MNPFTTDFDLKVDTSEPLSDSEVQGAAQYVVGVIGPTLTAAACGGDWKHKDCKAIVPQWTTGEAKPSSDQAIRLVVLARVIKMVSDYEGEDILRVWIIGGQTAPNGEEQTKLTMIRNGDFEHVLTLAYRLVTGQWG